MIPQIHNVYKFTRTGSACAHEKAKTGISMGVNESLENYIVMSYCPVSVSTIC